MGKTFLKKLTSVESFLQVLPLMGKWTEERQNENLVQPDLVRQDQDFYNLVLCFNFFTHLNIVELWGEKSLHMTILKTKLQG